MTLFKDSHHFSSLWWQCFSQKNNPSRSLSGKMIFLTPKSFFCPRLPSSSRQRKSEKPQQIAVQFHKNDFSRPKNHFFFRANCQAAVDNAKREKSEQFPAIATLMPKWFSRPKITFFSRHSALTQWQKLWNDFGAAKINESIYWPHLSDLSSIRRQKVFAFMSDQDNSTF